MKKNMTEGGEVLRTGASKEQMALRRAAQVALSFFLNRPWAVIMFLGLVLTEMTLAQPVVNAVNGLSCAGARPGGKLNCTAGEFTSIVNITNAPGSPTSCVAGESLTLIGTIELSGTNADRYNIGFFTGESGNDPQLAAGACSVATFPTAPSPWLDLDGNACGDFLNGGVSKPTIQNIKLLCEGNDSGLLKIPYVLTYAQNSNACTGPADVFNGAPSKCNSGTAQLAASFSVNGSVTIKKQTNPAGDTQAFTFTATGTGTIMTGDSNFSLVHGGSKQVRMAIAKAPRTLTITEGTANFWEPTVSISCTKPDGSSAAGFVTVNNATRTINASLSNDNPNAVCTITNTKRSKITMVGSVASRLNSTDQFTVSATGGGTLTDTSGTAISAPVTVTTAGSSTSASRTFWSQPGQSLTLTEATASGNLGNYDVSYTCTNATTGSMTAMPSGVGTGLSLVPAAGDDITCTFSNPLVTGACSPPPNIPNGVSVTCVCDNFGRTNLNPSTIFGANWLVSSSDGLNRDPYVNQTTGYLRLTEKTDNNAKAATVPGIFPAAGNYISVEFKHFAYYGTNTGADGVGVTLSDYSVPAVPGAFGGSLGYAQKSNPGSDCTIPGGCPGFAGGWIGVGLDEFGNFQSSTEGRVLGACNTGSCRPQSIGVRGPGSGMNGYRWLGGTASNPGGLQIDAANRSSTTPGPGYRYQVIVDARNYVSGNISVSVNRDATTKDGTNYSSLFSPFNAYGEASNAVSQGWISQVVPDYWKISFTGSTGSSTNIHEIDALRICAQTMYPPIGGTAGGFSAIDEAYPVAANSAPAYQNFQTGNIYMKLAGTQFKLWVAALTSTGISTAYSASSNKYVQVKLVSNADNACGSDAARTCNAACTGKSAVEAGGAQIITYTSSDKGAKLSPSFTLNSAWNNLVAVIRECSNSTCSSFSSATPACSVDSFSVRPTGISSISSTANNGGTIAAPSTSGTPIFRAGSDKFSLTATTTSGYSGVLQINNAALLSGNLSPAIAAGKIIGSFPAATSSAGSSTATGTDFTYSEVGVFYLAGYDPATNTASPRGIFDGVHAATECSGKTASECDALKAATWTGIDSVSTKGDCVADNYSNTKNTSGKYGCNFGLVANTSNFGRFVPDHFGVTGRIFPRSDLAAFSTGSINVASPTILTVPSTADAGKYIAGSLVRIAGAGTGGGVLVAKVVSAAGATVTLDTAASASVTGASVFPTDTYFYIGEPFLIQMTVTAHNGSDDALTTNYIGSLAMLDTSTLNASGVNWFNTGCAGSTQCFGLGAVNGSTGLSGRLAVDGSMVPSNTTWASGSSVFTLALRLNRLATPDVPFDNLRLGAAPRDADGVTIPLGGSDTHKADLNATDGNDLNSNPDAAGVTERRQIDIATKALYGRLWLANAFGSELLPLRIPVQAQFWTGTAWVQNVLDNLTALTVPTRQDTGNGTLMFSAPPNTPRNALNPGEVVACLGGVSAAAACSAGVPRMIRGNAWFWLTAGPANPNQGPGAGNFGYVDILARTNGAVAPIAPAGWLPATSDARACFGTCGPRSPVIYLRERY